MESRDSSLNLRVKLHSVLVRLSTYRMKKLILFIIFVAMLASTALYVVRSGNLFKQGIENFEGKQNMAASFAFAELITRYPNSPFVAVARAAMIHRDSANHLYMDLFFETRAKRDMFQSIVGRSPAYYDPYFFYAVAYFLILSLLAVAQRYWAGAKGLSFRALTGRDTFALLLCVLYYFWVRGSLTPDSAVFRLAGSVSPWLNTPVGATAVTFGFSVLMTAVNIVVTLLTLFTFLGSSRKKKKAEAVESLDSI